MSKFLRLSRSAKIISALFLALVAGFFLLHLLWKPGAIPPDFQTARLQGAVISQNIVDLSNQSAADVEKINELDQEKRYSEALNLTLQVVSQDQEIRNQAVNLSGELATMTQNLSGIDSLDARQAALESISNNLALLNQLIGYSNYLDQLLNILQKKFTGSAEQEKVSAIVNQINAEVTAVNSFNRQAVQAMERFDKALGK